MKRHEANHGAEPKADARARHLGYRGVRQVQTIAWRGPLDETRRTRGMVLGAVQGGRARDGVGRDGSSGHDISATHWCSAGGTT